jgi:4-hydroxybenzoyl-CoA reductase subunit beta
MQPLPDFELQRPANAGQAVALLAAQPGSRLVAGGTDLLPNMRRGLERPSRLVDLSALTDLSDIEVRADGSWILGAGLTLAALARDARVVQGLPALAEAAGAAAGPGHRSAATLGGNLCQDTRCVFYNQSEWWRAANQYCLKRGGSTCHVAPQGQRCHAAFSGDLAPVLLALRAEVELLSSRGTRRLPLHALYRDDGAAHLTLAGDELLTRVQLPAPAPGQRCAYRKARVRGAMDFPLAAVAVALAMDKGTIASLAVAISGIKPHPLLLDGTDRLVGLPVDDALLAALAKLVAKQVSPMRSTVTASNYRRQVASVTAQRLLRELAGAV